MDTRITNAAIPQYPNTEHSARDVLNLWRGSKFLLETSQCDRIDFGYLDFPESRSYRIQEGQTIHRFSEKDLERWLVMNEEEVNNL